MDLVLIVWVIPLSFRHVSRTLPFQNLENIRVIALSPKDDLLLSVDESTTSP